MNGGVGDHSYSKNSSLQRAGFDAAKALIKQATMENLDIKHISDANYTFRITDLGCSVGPNTFSAIQNIIEAIEHKHRSEGLISNLPEFHVFFNDLMSNDFNTLFASLPSEKLYFTAGFPGSFDARLFPEKSIHFVHSFAALHWLSRVPKELVNDHCINSPAMAPNEVMEAYSCQHAKDMEIFLDARAEEVVHGGLMALIFPGVPDGRSHIQSLQGAWLDILASTLKDLVNMGAVDEANMRSFNLPVYTALQKEVVAVVEKNGHFSIERTEAYINSMVGGAMASEVHSKHMRACFEGFIKEHFGSEIIEELFDLYTKKLRDSSAILEASEMHLLFFLLKRKEN